MTNALYDKGKEALLDGGINWLSDTIKAVLIDTALYTVNLTTHQYLSDIPVGARVATSAAFTGKTSTGGVADAADAVFAAVTGAVCGAVAIYKDTGVDATSQLIAYFDTMTGLPVTPNGGTINVVWDNGAYRIFQL